MESGTARKSSSRRWLSYALLGGAALAALLALRPGRRGAVASTPPAAPVAAPSTAAVPSPVPEVAKARPRVEIVFALDTTGSMGGLIEGAKRKIWSIASFVARGQPTPELRVGLIGYRDKGDDYVTRVYDLDDNLDKVYERLLKFRADGGGDTPEHVSRALHEAVHKMSWTDKQEVTKLVYLVGDAPAHTDYDDGYDYGKAARAAAKKGISVHTVRCGGDPETEQEWRKIASLGKGQYLSIEQDGGMRDIRTPFDDELARLHDKLGDNTMGWGRHAASFRARREMAAGAPAAAKADRASTYSYMGKGAGGADDLVEGWAKGDLKLGELRQEDLPAEIATLTPAQQNARVAEMAKNQETLRAEIKEVSARRDAYLAKEKDKGGEDRGFDAEAKRALKKSVADNPLSGLNL